MGISFFIGEPGMGKTTLAQELAVRRSIERGAPIVMLDPEGVLKIEGAVEFREVGLVGDAALPFIDAVWGRGQHVIYTPPEDGEEDLEVFFRQLKKGGNVIFLYDECSGSAAGSGASPALKDLCRKHRLYGVDLFFTTQYPADITALIWNLKAKVYMFRCRGTAAVDRLESELGLSDDDITELESLPAGRYLEWPNPDAQAPRQAPQSAPPDPGAPPADDASQAGA